MRDRLVTASAANATIALVAGVTTHLVAETRERHQLAATATVAVGRLITAAALLGASLKGRERLSLQITSNGPIKGIVADVMTLPDHTVGARAYARVPSADIALTPDGRFDVRTLVGDGKLNVTKSYEVGQPYNGVVNLVSGEIGADVAAYFAYSEQIPSVVALGVHMDNGGVRTAGGVIAQIMPGAGAETVTKLEANANAMDPVTVQLLRRADPEVIMEAICEGMQPRRLRDYDLLFACRCTREKVEKALLVLGHDELIKIASEQPQTEATCEFCKHTWVLSSAEVTELAARVK